MRSGDCFKHRLVNQTLAHFSPSSSRLLSENPWMCPGDSDAKCELPILRGHRVQISYTGSCSRSHYQLYYPCIHGEFVDIVLCKFGESVRVRLEPSSVPIVQTRAMTSRSPKAYGPQPAIREGR